MLNDAIQGAHVGYGKLMKAVKVDIEAIANISARKEHIDVAWHLRQLIRLLGVEHYAGGIERLAFACE